MTRVGSNWMGAIATATPGLVVAGADTVVCVVVIITVVVLTIKLRDRGLLTTGNFSKPPVGRVITLPSGATMFVRQ